MLTECCGKVQTYSGEAPHLNRPQSLLFNDVGLCLEAAGVEPSAVLKQIEGDRT